MKSQEINIKVCCEIVDQLTSFHGFLYLTLIDYRKTEQLKAPTVQNKSSRKENCYEIVETTPNISKLPNDGKIWYTDRAGPP